METNDYQYVTYDPRLFEYVLKTPVEELSTRERFEHSLETITTVLETSKPIFRPTHIEYEIADKEDNSVSDKSLLESSGLSTVEIVNAMREKGGEMESPTLAVFKLLGSVRITLSDSIQYLPSTAETSAIRSAAETKDGDGNDNKIASPLEIAIRQTGAMRPCETETLRIVGNSEHWLDGREIDSYLSESPPLAQLDQMRLASTVSQLYDAIDPVAISFENHENHDELFTPKAAIPAYEPLSVRHSVEWVLENFEQTQQGEDRLRLDYLGETVHPLISSPNGRVRRFLDEALAPERFEVGATATVVYPDDEVEFEKTPDGWRRNSE